MFWENTHQSQFMVNSANIPFETVVENILRESKNSKSLLKINKKVKVTGYFPESFSKLRESDGLTLDVLMESLDPAANAHNVFKAGEASGASGSFFFFSNDKKFIVKTMTKSEMTFFLEKFGKSYFYHPSTNRSHGLSILS